MRMRICEGEGGVVTYLLLRRKNRKKYWHGKKGAVGYGRLWLRRKPDTVLVTSYKSVSVFFFCTTHKQQWCQHNPRRRTREIPIAFLNPNLHLLFCSPLYPPHTSQSLSLPLARPPTRLANQKTYIPKAPPTVAALIVPNQTKCSGFDMIATSTH